MRAPGTLPTLENPGQNPSSRYRKVRDRASFAFALVSVAAVTWRMGDGAALRLHLNLNLNLSDTSQTDVPQIKGRQLWLSGYLGEGRLGPWTALWTIEV